MAQIQVGDRQISVAFDKSFQREALSKYLDKLILDERFRAKANKTPVATLKALGIKISKEDRENLKGLTIADAMRASTVTLPNEQAFHPVLILVIVFVFIPSC
jgi:hypothetical protein